MLGQVLSVDYSDSTHDIAFTYNRLGLPATVSDAAGTRTFTYNADFALTSEAIEGIYTQTITRTYTDTGAKGRILGMSIGAAGNYSYAYDAYGRLNTLTTSAGNFVYTPLADSNLPGTLTRPNNVNTTWSYETNRDLVTAVANGTLSTYSYVNDALGRRQSMAKSGSLFNPSETLSYAYNDRSEVTGASSDVNSNYSYFYAFDPIGNRLNTNLAGAAVSYTTNLLNQYTAVNTDNPTYDYDGNMLTNGAWTYTWNGENRLVSAVNGTQRVEFSYDFMGRRIEKKVYSGETLSKHLKFVYDGYKLVEELDGLNENALLRSYTWQPDSVGLDVPLSVTAGSSVYFYSTDANKNVTELTDNTGALAAHYEYSPFGMQTVATGAFASENPFRFSSEYYDAETGLVYYNYRYYSPLLGRWIKRDPIGEEGGMNLYGMAGNNVISEIDYFGLYSIDFHYYVIYYLLRAKCWCKEEASRIAGFSQYVDENSNTEPIRNTSSRAKYHFPGSTPTTATIRNDPTARKDLVDAIRQYERGGSGVTARLGASLHTYADSWGHEGFTAWHSDEINTRTGSWWRPNLGHADAENGGHAPDYPFNDVAKALEAARNIFDKIPDKCNGNSVSWNDIEKHLRLLFSYQNTDDSKRSWRWQLGIKAKFGDKVSYDTDYFENKNVVRYYDKALGY